MNIYIFTGNYYLFNGIKHALSQLISAEFLHTPLSSMKNIITSTTDFSNDIYIISAEREKLDFLLLLKLHQKNAPVVLVNNKVNWKADSILNFNTIPDKSQVINLAQAIIFKRKRYNKTTIPYMTPQELEVLKYTAKGVSIYNMGYKLKISTKTAYSHQRNAFRKIGIRKTTELLLLPKNYIEYICGSWQFL